MHWKLRLDCGDCGAQLTFRDERPEWEHEGDLRFVACPACGGRAKPPGARQGVFDFDLGKAFAAFGGGGGGRRL